MLQPRLLRLLRAVVTPAYDRTMAYLGDDIYDYLIQAHVDLAAALVLSSVCRTFAASVARRTRPMIELVRCHPAITRACLLNSRAMVLWRGVPIDRMIECAAAGAFPCVQTLSLCGTRTPTGEIVSSAHLERLCACIRTGRAVRRLNTLHVCDIALRTPSLYHLCDAISHLRCLTQLVCTSNALQDDGAQHLCACLSGCRLPLTYLGLSNNRIGSAGMYAVVDLLYDHRLLPLRHLSLSRNRIDDQGICYLAHRARVSTARSLSGLHIDLSRNSMTTRSAVNIGLVVRLGHLLCTCNMTYNSISAIGVRFLTAAINLNPYAELQYADE